MSRRNITDCGRGNGQRDLASHFGCIGRYDKVLRSETVPTPNIRMSRHVGNMESNLVRLLGCLDLIRLHKYSIR